MNEKFLSYIWFNKLYFEEQQTLMGESVKIISPGIPNFDAGPDVFNAKIRIADKIWAGNVEFHVKASDWHRHRHDNNPLYSHVILHVVLQADEQIYTEAESAIPTILLAYPKSLLDGYSLLVDEGSMCPINFSIIDTIHVHQFIDRLVIDRLQTKLDRISDILKSNNNNWEQAFYIVLSRAFGFGVNSDSMQLLSMSIPFNIILHHRDNFLQLEALFLGQAGLLSNIRDDDEYTSLLVREYRFMCSKYNIIPAERVYLKFLRMRPASFPTIRISQLACLYNKQDNLFSNILENVNKKYLYKLFNIKTSEYWSTHYNLCIPTEKHGTQMSKSSIDILIINTVVPFIFHYAKIVGDYELQSKAIDILREIKPEKNRKIQFFTKKGFVCENAYDSQALIQLYDKYCMNKDCLRCNFAHQFLKQR